MNKTLFLFAILIFSVGTIGAAPIPGVNISPFGCQTVWPHDAKLDSFLNRMEEAEIQWGRSDMFWWGLIEAETGVYKFNGSTYPGYSNYDVDSMVQKMKQRGIEPFPILGYSSPLYDGGVAPLSDTTRAAFGNYAGACAAHFKNEITYWEIWNEPNLEFFFGRAPNAEDYVKIVAAASQKIREANPDAKIAGGVTAGIDLTYLTSCFQFGLLDYVDVITIHPYRGTKPETINTEIAQLNTLIDTYTTASIKIWTGEWGYNTYAHNLTEKSQAKALARMMMNNISVGIEVSIWFSIHAFPESSGTINDEEWGLLDYNLNPRPSFYAMQTLNKLMPPPVKYVGNPFKITASPAVTNLRIETLEQGNSKHHFVAVWVAAWPPSDSYSGRTTSLTLEINNEYQIKAFDALTGADVALQISQTGNKVKISSLKVMDYPYYIEVTEKIKNAVMLY